MTGPHCRSGLTGNSDSLLNSVLFASTILAAACAFVLPGPVRAQPQEKAQVSTPSPVQASAQVPAKPAEQKPEVSESTTELKTHDTKGTLKVRVNLDDVHLAFEDLARARDAADHQITAAGQPGDRAGIYTTSGQTTLDFIDDRAKLHETLEKLRPHPVGRSGVRECPDVSYYMADLIQTQHDSQALQVATLDALACAFGNDPMFLQQAQQLAQATVQRMLSVADAETQYSLRLLAEIVRRMTLLPGQRSMILISPGFLITDRQSQMSEILDHAVRANIVVNSVDARGLYASPPGGDISQGGGFTNNAAVG